MEIKVINYSKILYQGDIISIIAPGVYGYFQVLENHDHFISILGYGIIKLVFGNGNRKKMKIKGGIFRIKNNSIIVIL
ncbi:FoF1 ATP synthase subunit delta/epsilon [Blattabacterium cuenoti]|uniref:FoF1 ATP synthase subunit delta/epsilon n=1 Tax=Blattabacterium cuenoti TaxID=1653831 RepID=UPI00163C5583|nr:F0F1 ATP synthase subunit epsilon [Blattabacterium cuenoti]